MSSDILTAEKVEERWTPTTIQVTFILPSLVRSPKSGGISIGLPLLNLGWTFALSLTPRLLDARKKRVGKSVRSLTKTHQWNLVALAFRRDGGAKSWGDTCMRAQLLLATDPPFDSDCPPPSGNNSTPLGTMEVALAGTHSEEIPLKSYTLSLLSPTKISLTVTISGYPFSNGFFHVASNRANEAGAQAWLAKQSGDRLLSQSLTTGKFYDVRFLTYPTRSTLGNNEKPLETYASLSVLEGHISSSSAKISERWASALAALNRRDDPDTKPVAEISCPDSDKYELDSDFDEDEASYSAEPCVSSPPGERDSATLEGQQSESKTESSSSFCSSLEFDGASDLGSADSHLEELIKDPGEPPQLSSEATSDYKPTVLVKFAAHRTWHAFLWYCYTGHLEFSKLKSQVEHGVRHLHAVEDVPPSCSPKSMYRLADLVGDDDLKAKALKAIGESMTEANVLDETFSVFTSKYPDVREVQLDVLMEHCESPEVKKAFLRTMSKFGNMGHAEPVLEAFYDRLAA